MKPIILLILLFALAGCLKNPLGEVATVQSNYEAGSPKALAISDIANQSIAQNALATIAFTISKENYPNVTCSGSVIGSSNNTSLVTNGNIVISGTAPNCIATITPEVNAIGITTITLTVRDGIQQALDTFSLTVVSTNNAPTISNIADQVVLEDSGATAIAFTISDVETTLTCAGSVSKASSNSSVFVSGGIIISGTAPNCLATITPIANSFGVSTITLTVSDGVLTNSDSFQVTVTSVNDLPIISNVADQVVIEDTATPVAFTISDIESSLTCASAVTGSSSNTGVFTAGGIVITGTAPNCIATLTPVLNANGSSTITLTVSDGSATASDTFLSTISSRPDLVNVIAPLDGVYGIGSSIIFELIYDINTAVSGNPRIPLTVGSSTFYANYSGGTGSTSLLFTYVVGSGQNDSNGIVANTTVDLNGGTITSSGFNSPLNMAGLLSSLANVKVDTTITPPSAVATLTQTNLSADRTQASFTWVSPAPGSAAITEYRVQYRKVGDADFTTISPAPTTNSVTLTGLTTEVNYEVRVAAFNGVFGPYSSLLSFSTIFTPRSLNALIWYEAKDINGTGVVPSNGAAISTLVDKSGKGNNAALISGETAGVIQTTNGQKVLRVSNSVYTTAASLGEVSNTDVEVYLVSKVNVVAGSFAFCNENYANATDRYSTHFPWSDGKAYIDLPIQNRVSIPWGGNLTDIFTWTFRASTTQGTALERNGVSIISAGNKTNTTALKKWSLFGYPTGTQNWSADFVAIFVFDKVLTSTQRQEFFNYVETNYGVIMP